MAMYLDISALRIQQYLVRYPRLRSIAAASAMLAEETRWEAIEDIVGDRAEPNPAAGDADGKISLLVQGGDVEKLALDVVAHLQTRLPAARFEAHWADAHSYPDALMAMTEQRGIRTGIVTAPPVNAVPFRRLCDRCVASPATRQVQDIDGMQWSCKDCAERVPDIRSGDRRRGAPVLEGYRLPNDFDELAKLGRDRKKNHLATIYADGNSLGKFFKDAVKVCTSNQLNQLSAAVTEATREGLEAAAEAIQPDGEVDEKHAIATVAHVVGGDDVLVTVPASFGWEFARVYLSAFSALMERTLTEVVKGTDLAVPTASAGIVFSHKSYPFAAVFELAGEVLSLAKRGEAAESLQEAAIDWVDITSEGSHVPEFRRPISLATLDSMESQVDGLARVPASSRSNLERYLNTANPFVAAARVRKLQRRLQFDALESFVSDLPTIPLEEPTKDEDVRAAREQVHRLRNYLSLTDWWPV